MTIAAPDTDTTVVVTRPLVGRWREILEQAGRVELVGGPEGPDRAALIEQLAGARALVCLLTDPIDADLLAAASSLEVVGNCAVGVDNVDLEAAWAREITVCHTPAVLTDATADLTMALLLSVARRLPEAEAFVRAGSWTGWRPDDFLGLELRDRRLGIIGLGRIGRAVAERAVAFGMEVVYWGRRPADGASAIPARLLELDELLATSDAVSLHVPLTESTHHLLDERRLRSMKRDALLINTARGAVIDEAALTRVLHDGHLGGAGLDVFEREPKLAPGLLEAPRVLPLPHIGSATHRARARMAEIVCRDVVRVLSGGEPHHAVRP